MPFHPDFTLWLPWGSAGPNFFIFDQERVVSFQKIFASRFRPMLRLALLH